MLMSKADCWMFLCLVFICFSVKILLSNVCMSSPVSRNQDPQSCEKANVLFKTVLSSKASSVQHAISLIELFKKLVFLLLRKKAGLSCIYIQSLELLFSEIHVFLHHLVV